VGDMYDGHHVSPPGNAHDLRRLIDEQIEAGTLQATKTGGNRRRGQIVQQERAVVIRVLEASVYVAFWSRRLVISVDDEQLPGSGMLRGERMEPFRTPGGGEMHPSGHTTAGQGLFDQGSELRV